MEKETIEHKGITFYRYPNATRPADRRYFRSRKAEAEYGERYLHRLIYKDFYGSIPEGMHVHHIDGDFANNDPKNLDCITPAEHLKLHPNDPEKVSRHMKYMQELAKDWHASDEGLEWHKKHWNRSLAKAFVTRNYVCERCGAEYESSATQGTRFCSNKCKAAWRRDSGVDDETRSCKHCGGEFTVNKYYKTKYCSRQCSADARKANVDSGVRL
jgi:hypothetical protein